MPASLSCEGRGLCQLRLSKRTLAVQARLPARALPRFYSYGPAHLRRPQGCRDNITVSQHVLPQIRALLYVGALSNGILEALAHAERAVTDAIVTPVRHPCCKGQALHAMLGVKTFEQSIVLACHLVTRCLTCGACHGCRACAVPGSLQVGWQLL